MIPPLVLPEAHQEALRVIAEVYPLPSSYLVIDCETTGFSCNDDYAVDIGWLRFDNGQIAEAVNFEINWPEFFDNSGESRKLIDFQQRLEKCAASMHARGEGYPYTVERLRMTGFPPLQVFTRLREAIFAAVHVKAAIVGHNVLAFDLNMLTENARRLLGNDIGEDPFQLDRADICDTGLTEKAIQLADPTLPMHDWPQQLDFYKSMSKMSARGVKWSLANCIRKYMLEARYRFPSGVGHEARYHCFATHFLLQTFRQAAYGEAPPVVGGPRRAYVPPQAKAASFDAVTSRQRFLDL